MLQFRWLKDSLEYIIPYFRKSYFQWTDIVANRHELIIYLNIFIICIVHKLWIIIIVISGIFIIIVIHFTGYIYRKKLYNLKGYFLNDGGNILYLSL